ncbi:Alpha-ketoglutarate-dependent dioxygenase AlkB [Xenorhabdus szentirmaii DSM 16338]|uniref:Alpha-ketoglutarate-dependent dioxygenase AlkB n=1 Tax=Xenorhabdus szentirmaii DSM 16338 TaxID=1427518 RepID=W1J2X1_9GAMM|nr:DNA oxidative demethylase AlkB [Xenorhabdus szentirmaii]PHM34667.1 alpha-ketoglutarate-dependent dioxygenase AlkB [Xenorhabdus szentirmaii DSM 16338]CDL85097.1 Alpha-ketoglutarate-dependent dioxygenase AlkB [Xenorhabdus szentirmaii DSM 16338]
MLIDSLFANDDSISRQWQEPLAKDSVVLRGFAYREAHTLLHHIMNVAKQAPFYHFVTPSGHVMSIAITNCGSLGWTSSQQGYLYTRTDPLSGQAWPSMPAIFRQIAQQAASDAGYSDFLPDACLINRYYPGSRLSLHQDKDEDDLSQPIVSVSLGLTATFLFGGLQREHPKQRITLTHGDIVVWGGDSRLNYHGILPLKNGIAPEPLQEQVRYNLTFRRVTRA